MLIASVLRTVERRFEQISAIVTIKTRKKITAPTKVLNINNKVSSSVSPPSPSQKDFGPSSAWGFVETELGKVEVLLTVDVMLRALFSGHGISTASCSIAIAVSDALMFLEIVLASFGSFCVLQRFFTLAIFLISGELVDLKMVTVVVRGVADVALKVVVVEAGMVVVLVANFVVEAVVIGGVGVVITVLFLVEAGVGVVGATVDLVVETVILVVVVVFVVVVLVVVGGAVVDPVVLGAHSAHPPQAIVHLHLVSQGLAAPGHQL